MSASQVSFRYSHSDTEAVVDLQLEIEPGQFVVLSGPSGCGKTTLTRLLNGLIPHFHEGELTGRVRVFGREPAEQQIWQTATEVGSVFQNPRSQFFTTDPVSEIAFGCENLGLTAAETRDRVAAALRDFELDFLRTRSIFALSGGEKQRLACAAVAATTPRLYVLDEPSANLDAIATQRLRAMMEMWKASGATVVVAEHRLGYLRDMADRLIVMDGGRVVDELSGDSFRAMDDGELAVRGLRSVAPRSIPVTRASGRQWEASNLSFRYRTRTVPGVRDNVARPALQRERLSLPKGRITALIGANGTGKTTLARWMAGQLPSQGGVLMDEGQPLSRKQRRRRVFLVLQDVNHQLVTESVADEIAVTLRLAGVRDEREVERDRILQTVDLEGYGARHPMSLSGGEKQRLAIGTALASKRDLIVLDEPTSGLDLIHMRQVAAALRELTEDGRTVLVATHDTELIAACADHVISLDREPPPVALE